MLPFTGFWTYGALQNTTRVTKSWHRLPREVVKSPSLEILKKQPGHRSGQLSLGGPSWAGKLDRTTFGAPFQPQPRWLNEPFLFRFSHSLVSHCAGCHRKLPSLYNSLLRWPCLWNATVGSCKYTQRPTMPDRTPSATQRQTQRTMGGAGEQGRKRVKKKSNLSNMKDEKGSIEETKNEFAS